MENVKTCKIEINVAKEDQRMESKGVENMNFKKCELKEVMLVPELSTNLLSVSQITKNGGEVTFSDEKVIVRQNNKIA